MKAETITILTDEQAERAWRRDMALRRPTVPVAADTLRQPKATCTPDALKRWQQRLQPRAHGPRVTFSGRKPNRVPGESFRRAHFHHTRR